MSLEELLLILSTLKGLDTTNLRDDVVKLVLEQIKQLLEKS